MAEFRVTWEVDIEAGSAIKAARCALAMQRDIESSAVFFTTENMQNGRKYAVDLADPLVRPSPNRRLNDKSSESSKTQIACLLKARFNWLGTDKEADGGDVVEALADLYEQLGGKA